MTKHVFVETSWLVDCLKPAHLQKPEAQDLFYRCKKGEFKVHLPAPCVGEARRAIRKFQPRQEADLVRSYVKWAVEKGEMTSDDRNFSLKILEKYEADTSAQIEQFDATVAVLKTDLDIFPMDQSQLDLSIKISLNPQFEIREFDQAVLAAVLAKSVAIRTEESDSEICFCELDSDLWPWDKKTGARRGPLADLYDEHRVWVYRDFTMQHPVPPIGWPKSTA